MKYNPTNHSIEFDDGRLCCKLSEEEVSTEQAYLYTDNISNAKDFDKLKKDYEDLDAELAAVEKENSQLVDQIEDLEFDLERAEGEFRDAKRRVGEPDEVGWWWFINPRDNFSHYPAKVFEINDELMIQFANQTIPVSLLKERFPQLNDFYKAYLPEY